MYADLELKKAESEAFASQKINEAKEMVSVVIPAYNEGKEIYKNLNSYIKAFEGLGLNFEIVLIDDGSTDNTYQEALRVDHPSISCLRYGENKGKGFALAYGVHWTKGEFITFMDADADLPPEQLEVFIEYLSQNGADGVIGSKRHPEANVYYPIKRKFLSYGYHILTRFLFNLPHKDTQTGLKLFKRGVLRKVLPRIVVKKYAFDLEVIAVAHHLGFKIVEAPIVIDYQFNGSMVTWRQIWQIFIDTIAIFYRLRILKYYDHVDEFYLGNKNIHLIDVVKNYLFFR